MTRDLDWGVRVPVAGYDERDDKRIYVWIDAVVGYLSASVEWAALGRRGRVAPLVAEPGARHFYFMGKDNIVFHSVIWPAQLLGYGEGGELGAGRGARAALRRRLERVLTMEGKQFSTSRNVVVHVGDFLDRYSADSLRYYLTAAGPETHDTDFTGGVRAAQQRRARCHLGQPRQSGAPERVQELPVGSDRQR